MLVRYRFADCELRTDTRELLRDGRPLPVQPKVFDLLVSLARRGGELAGDEALRAELWPGVRVAGTSLRRLVKEARRAIGDDGSRQALILTVRRAGYRLLAAVVAEETDERRIVGREHLLAGIDERLRAAQAGRGGLVLLEGTAGAGKTELALAARRRAERLGLAVVLVHVASDADPYRPWRDALRTLVTRVPALAERVPPALREPALSGAEPAVAPSSAAAEQLRLLEALEAALEAAASVQPLALIFDDLHDADPDTIKCFSFLAPRLLARRIWILASYRADALHAEGTLPLAELARSRHAAVWDLHGLSLDEVVALVAVRTGERDWRELAALLHARTDGNPFWIDAVLRDLVERGRFGRGETLTALEAEMHAGLRPLLRRRLAAAAEPVESVLRHACALGVGFDEVLLAHLIGLPAPRVTAALVAAERAQLVVREHAGAPRWRFSHELIREALYAQLGEVPGERARMHRAITELLETSPDRAARAGEIAHHAECALPLVARERALALRVAAARAARAAGGHEEEARQYARAVALCAGDAAEKQRRRGELLRAQGDALLAAEGVSSARVAFAQAAEAARRAGDDAGLARAALGFAHRRSATGRVDGQIVALLEESLARLGANEPGIALRLRSRLGAELLLAEPRARGEAIVAQALVEARALGDRRVLGWVLDDQAYAVWSPRDTRSWVALCSEIERVGREIDDPELAFRGARSQATGLLELGDRAGLDSALARCAALVRDQPLRHARALMAGMYGMLALLEGRLADARRHVAEAAELGAGSDELGLQAQIGVQVFLLHREEGSLAALAPKLAALQERYPALWGLRLLGTLVVSEHGSPAEARAELERFARESLPLLPLDRNWMPTLSTAAEVALAVGAAPVAAALEARLAPFAALGAVVGSCGAFLGSVSHALGLAALTRGRPAEAIARLEVAERMHAGLGAAPWLARTRGALARAREMAMRCA